MGFSTFKNSNSISPTKLVQEDAFSPTEMGNASVHLKEYNTECHFIKFWDSSVEKLPYENVAGNIIEIHYNITHHKGVDMDQFINQLHGLINEIDLNSTGYLGFSRAKVSSGYISELSQAKASMKTHVVNNTLIISLCNVDMIDCFYFILSLEQHLAVFYSQDVNLQSRPRNPVYLFENDDAQLLFIKAVRFVSLQLTSWQDSMALQYYQENGVKPHHSYTLFNE